MFNSKNVEIKYKDYSKQYIHRAHAFTFNTEWRRGTGFTKRRRWHVQPVVPVVEGFDVFSNVYTNTLTIYLISSCSFLSVSMLHIGVIEYLKFRCKSYTLCQFIIKYKFDCCMSVLSEDA